MTPILIFFFGVKPYMAVGTDLLFAAFTKAGGTISLMKQRLVPWRVVGQLCAGSIPAALITLYVLHATRPSQHRSAKAHDHHAGWRTAADGGCYPVQGHSDAQAPGAGGVVRRAGR